MTSPIALGASIFPLILVNQPVINLEDAFNEMLQLVAIQCANNAGANFLAPAAVNAGATITLTQAQSNTTIMLNAAGGSVATLPAATGSGARFRFLQTAAAPSSAHKVQVANAGDFMMGIITTVDSAVVTGYVAANSGTVATNSDTVSLSATTTGGLNVGAWIDVEDVAANTWSVRGQTSSSGTAATPFSAAV